MQDYGLYDGTYAPASAHAELVNDAPATIPFPGATILSINPGDVLREVHDLEKQAKETTDPVLRRQLMRAACDLLDAALKELELPAA